MSALLAAAGATGALCGFSLWAISKRDLRASSELAQVSSLKKKRVLITRVIETKKLAEFCETFDVELGVKDNYMSREELLAKVKGCHAALIYHADKPDEAFFQAAGLHMQAIANYGAGYDTVDVDAATKRGICVCNTPDVVAEDTADIALCLLLCSCRRVSEAHKWTSDGLWASAPPSDGLNAFWGISPHGKVLGIVGLGSIGLALAKRARQLGLRVVYHNRKRCEDREAEVEADYCPTLHELLAQSDFVSLHCPLSASTRHLIGEEEFGVMKKGVFIINTARGAVIDENALVRNIRSGKVRGVGLDVFEEEPKVHPELLEMSIEGHPHITIVPHIGTATEETRRKMFDMCLENIERVLKGTPPISPVNQVASK